MTGGIAAEDSERGRELSLISELSLLLNSHNRENKSDTADFLLAEFLLGCLKSYESVVNRRERLLNRAAPQDKPDHEPR